MIPAAAPGRWPQIVVTSQYPGDALARVDQEGLRRPDVTLHAAGLTRMIWRSSSPARGLSQWRSRQRGLARLVGAVPIDDPRDVRPFVPVDDAQAVLA